MSYDLLIKGGRLIDPAAGLDQIADVAFKGDRTVVVEPDIAPDRAERLIDAAGLVVVPGLIDFHAHALFLSGLGLGGDLDAICASHGVTTLVDGGSSGAATFPVFKELLIDRAETRILAFLHISSIGLAELAVGESTYLDLHRPEAAAEVASAHPGLIVGIKVRQQAEVVGDNGLEPLKLAKRAAALAGGLPIMVHVTNPAAPLPEIFDLLDGGDIVSHIYHGRGDGLLDADGAVRTEVIEARQRGVLFDSAHGSNHFNFNVARKALESGFAPDAAATDLTRKNMRTVVKSLPNVLSKLINLGLDLNRAIACATSQPAAILGRSDDLGTLAPGAAADAAVFELKKGEFQFKDADGNRLIGETMLEPAAVVRRGRLVWQR